MQIRTVLAVVAILGLTFVVHGNANEPDGAINVSAGAYVKVLPSRFRLQTVLAATGETPEKAIAELQAKREHATKQLKGLKADLQSIKFGVPQSPPAAQAVYAPAVPSFGPAMPPVSSAGIPAQPPQATWVPEGSAGVHAPVPIPTPPAIVPAAPTQIPTPNATNAPAVPAGSPVITQPTLLGAAVCDLTVEWPLDKSNPDTILLQGVTIQQKVLASNLWGDKKAGADAFVGASCSFWYVAVFSDADRKSALARACQQAEKNAALLAEAAKVQVGALLTIGTQCDYCGPIGSGPISSIATATTSVAQLIEGEAVSTLPERFTFTVNVTAKYRLIRPSEKK